MVGRVPSRSRLAILLALLALTFAGCADLGVVVSSSAVPGYTKGKFSTAAPRQETYVFMAGHYFPGITIDRELERMDVRNVAELIAPELARQQFLPAKDFAAADLVIVIHWGVTSPHDSVDNRFGRLTVSLDQTASLAAAHTTNLANEQVAAAGSNDLVAEYVAMGDPTSAENMEVAFDEAIRRTDAMSAEYDRANATKLLGYGRQLRKAEQKAFLSAAEATLRSDLETERYFIVLQAYDVRHLVNRKPKLVWTLHLNMRSAGNNFKEAVALMAEVAPKFAGRDLAEVDTVLPTIKEGRVNVGEIIIVGDR